MGNITKIQVMVEGGKATAGPPIGSSIGPLGVNTKAVVDDINNKTKGLSGIKIPVTIEIDTDTKEFKCTVGTPPVAALIKKELNLEKGSGEAGKQRIADLKISQAKKIAKMKFGSDDNSFVSQVTGTARSMGISVGEGAVTEEEKQAYEEQKAAEEAETKAKEEAKAAAAPEKPGEEKPGEKPTEAPKEGEAKPEEKPEAKPEEKPEEKK